MYKVVDKTFDNFDEGKYGKPIICLEDQYGGRSVIIMDDHCYVLMNGSDKTEFKIVTHWYMDVVIALAGHITEVNRKIIASVSDDV